jgi:hypothetical protein
MSVLEAIRTRKIEEGTRTHRTRIEDLPLTGKELSEEHLEMVAGGMRRHYGTLIPNSCTANCDVDGEPD